MHHIFQYRTMKDDRTRSAVALYLTGALTAEEATRRADISRAELRHYARTAGTVVVSSEVAPTGSDTEPA
jgi:hypothetical protein